MAGDPANVRPGHALGGRDELLPAVRHRLRQVIAIAGGKDSLQPRDPTDSKAVWRAEEILKADPRPIYAYLGDLHPDLGTVGLIFDRGWVRRVLQGLTRCDSGGIAGGHGGFSCLMDEEVELTLLDLSRSFQSPADDWEGAFSEELESSYSRGAGGYVRGEAPDTSFWTDARARCISHANALGNADRRLWTWEVRMLSSPTPEELVAVIVSPEAFKHLNDLHAEGEDLPETVQLVVGELTSADATHWFYSTKARNLLLGAS